VNDKQLGRRLRESIIDSETILRAVAHARQCKPRGRRGPLDLLESEPALQEFLKGALLEVAGEMAIHGCEPSVIRAVYREAAFLLAVTFNSVGQAHRDLYADLLPQTEPEATASHADQDLSPGPDGGKEANRPSKKESKP
jgi:hypothetical protein